jgi:hypothetical protein
MLVWLVGRPILKTNPMLKRVLLPVMVSLPLCLRAVTFSGAQTAATEWTYTLTYAPLDNYSIFDAMTTITLTGLAGVTGADGPVSTDFPSAFIDQINTNWIAEVLDGGTAVRWTHIGPGTGNWDIDKHVFGFRVHATGAMNGSVSLITSGFSRDTSNPLPDGTFDVDITGTANGPVATVDSDGDGVPDTEDQCPNTPAGAIVNGHGCSIGQLVPCAGPLGGGTWKNHGQYVSAVTKATKDFVQQGVMTRQERHSAVREAAHSDCGKKPKKPKH